MTTAELFHAIQTAIWQYRDLTNASAVAREIFGGVEVQRVSKQTSDLDGIGNTIQFPDGSSIHVLGDGSAIGEPSAPPAAKPIPTKRK